MATLPTDQEQSAPFLPLIKKGSQDKATPKNSFLLLKREPTSKVRIEKMYVQTTDQSVRPSGPLHYDEC